MVASGVSRPACEFDRAYQDLIVDSAALAPRTSTPCSPEAPELRAYPAPPSGGRNYVLCNGHLTDLFDARERAALPVVPAGLG